MEFFGGTSKYVLKFDDGTILAMGKYEVIDGKVLKLQKDNLKTKDGKKAEPLEYRYNLKPNGFQYIADLKTTDGKPVKKLYNCIWIN